MEQKFYLRWRNPANQRRYMAYLCQDLFGDWVLIRSWCSETRKGEQIRKTAYCSFEEALTKFQAVEKRRKQHGYVLID